jgi:hypothetical protein
VCFIWWMHVQTCFGDFLRECACGRGVTNLCGPPSRRESNYWGSRRCRPHGVDLHFEDQTKKIGTKVMSHAATWRSLG